MAESSGPTASRSAKADNGESQVPAQPNAGTRQVVDQAGTVRRALIVLAIIAALTAAVSQRWTLCATAGIFGIPCPGCGLTRATLAALQGDWATAWHLYPLFPLVAPIYIYLVVTLGFRFVAGARAKPVSKRTDRVVSILAGVAIVLVILVWASRFLGAFGGPVPVTTWRELIR